MMNFPEKGLTKEEVLNKMKEKKKQDFDWKSGKIFCSVYDGGEEVQEVVKEAYMSYLTENPVDPTLFPSLRDMETEVVAMSADILRGPDAVGSLTTGGTESILLAIKTAKNRAKALKPHLTKHEIILPYTVHSAFFKACDYFDVIPVITKLTDDYKADAKAIKEAITENTIMITASAPSYVFGVIDPIKEIGEIALEHDIPFHVDACIGGIILSFKRLGNIGTTTDFDFSVPGVTSISMDWHKYGYAAKGCSVLLHKNKDYRRHQFFVCTEWTGYTLVNTTILSTKSGGPIAGCWAAINFIGKDGYIQLSKDQMETTQKFITGINAFEELYVMGNPESSLLSFTSDTVNIYDLMDEMVDRGWFLQFQLKNDYSKANLHLTIARAHKDLADNFLKDLRDAVDQVKKKGFLKKASTKATVKAVSVLAKNMSPGNFEKLGKMLGFSNGKVPDKLALVNEIMDTLPDETVKNTLLEYFNDFYTYSENR
jgi:sphinganine-1-phosphate aldolase